jgi:hypothetical protein
MVLCIYSRSGRSFVLRPPVFEKYCDIIYPQRSKTRIASIEGKIKKPIKIRKSDA